MRTINRLVLIFCLGLAVFGCGKEPRVYNGPTVDAFHGKVTHNGNPVTFAENEEAQLTLYHETGKPYGIPLKTDGTFEIGWMPTGKYTDACLNEHLQNTPRRVAGKTRYGVPEGLNIEAGKTNYVIELGKNLQTLNDRVDLRSILLAGTTVRPAHGIPANAAAAWISPRHCRGQN